MGKKKRKSSRYVPLAIVVTLFRLIALLWLEQKDKVVSRQLFLDSIAPAPDETEKKRDRVTV